MKKVIYAIVGIVLVATMASCGHSGFKKTSTGMLYDIISDGKGEKLKNGDIVKINFEIKMGDSVMNSTAGKVPIYDKVDTSRKNMHNVLDLYPELKVGDSASFVMFVDTLRKMGQIGPNAPFKAGATIKGWAKIVAKFKNEDEKTADQKNEVKLETDREVATIEKYLKDKNITTTKSPNGVFVHMDTPGNGPEVTDGKTIKVKYRGTNFAGKMFDSNMDTGFHSMEPLSFVAGAQGMIPGWGEGMKFFKQGGKGKVYIPAMQGFGPQGQSEILQPYTNLIFDIEVLEVKDTPPAPPTAANKMTPEQQRQMMEQMQQQQSQQQQPGQQKH